MHSCTFFTRMERSYPDDKMRMVNADRRVHPESRRGGWFNGLLGRGVRRRPLLPLALQCLLREPFLEDSRHLFRLHLQLGANLLRAKPLGFFFTRSTTADSALAISAGERRRSRPFAVFLAAGAAFAAGAAGAAFAAGFAGARAALAARETAPRGRPSGEAQKRRRVPPTLR